MRFTLSNKKISTLTAIIFLFALISYIAAIPLNNHLQKLYALQQSAIIEDRHGEFIYIKPNGKGYYTRFAQEISPQFKKLLLKKEDRFFYYHLGMNPISISRDAFRYVFKKRLNGSSTITQQLIKILLGNETQRTFKNKIVEAVYSVGLELHASKEEILTMYANTAYFGNSAQGIEEASLYYFNKPSESLDTEEILQLIATLNNPSNNFPGTYENTQKIKLLASLYDIRAVDYEQDSLGSLKKPAPRKNNPSFELETLGIDCSLHCEVTLDSALTETLRDMLRRNLNTPEFDTVENGAIVVIKIPENEILAIIGSANPNSLKPGSQINMAIKPRPIGSTAKPFIYMKAFEKGARPYSLVDDREYKYEIGTGFAFYPKNYDGQYRGEVTLHEALSNSLNVPSVKVLEYTGVKSFSSYLTEILGFESLQPIENYELGIALGALEMDLLTLSGYFTIFANKGVLKPITIITGDANRYLALPMQQQFVEEQRVIDYDIIQLINKILSDRETGVAQFGIKSDLNLAQKNYALKTGTSRDFHDSWTMGYTPDFLVGVWIGNSDNTPMRRISGQLGAGKIWHEAMDIMMNSPYNKKTPFAFDKLESFSQSGSIEYGLPGDDYYLARNLLKIPDLIRNPHHGDTFLYEPNMRIPLIAEESVEWFVNDAFLSEGDTGTFRPSESGAYTITVKTSTGEQKSVTISVQNEEY